MKIKIRFISFFTIALFCFLCYFGIVMAFFFEFVFPFFGINVDDSFLSFLCILLFVFLSAAVLFSFVFVKPLLLILSTLKHLSENQYDLTRLNTKVQNRKGNIKKRYFLFRETIYALNELSAQLACAKKERKQLEQAKKDWVKGISHDLKTPLSYVLGYSALLSNMEYDWNPKEQQKFLTEIYSKGKYMEDLVCDLYLSFEIENPQNAIPLSKTDFDLIPFLQNLIADTANNPKAAKNTFCFQTAVLSISIHADEKLLYRAFQNLMVNCVLHNPPQTKIALSVLSFSEDIVEMQVIDNGVGFSKTDKAIFVDESSYQKGWNGLAIVKNIILAHGGKISLNSQENKGSTFTIFLPCH